VLEATVPRREMQAHGRVCVRACECVFTGRAHIDDVCACVCACVLTATRSTRRLREAYVRFGDAWAAAPDNRKIAEDEGAMATQLGAAQRAEQCLVTFAASMRFGGDGVAEPQCAAKTLRNKLVMLQGALRASQCADGGQLPQWAQAAGHGGRAGLGLLLRSKLKEWRIADQPTRAAARKQAQLTESDIEAWCLMVLKDLVVAQDPNTIDLQARVCHALLLRVQAGCNNHHKYVASTPWSACGWEDAVGGDRRNPYTEQADFKVMKLCSLSSAMTMAPVVHMYITDAITRALFRQWWEWHGEGREPGDFFFPKRVDDGFDFKRPLSDGEHNAACRDCATRCGLPLAASDVKMYTSMAVRRGVGGAATRALASAMHGANRETGRAEGSRMNSSTYTTEAVWREPGPLYADVARIQQRYEEEVTALVVERKRGLLCSACAMPHCECNGCRFMGCKAHASRGGGHSCWLRGLKGQTPRVGRLARFADDKRAEVTERIRKAWADRGCADQPTWSVRCRRFEWAGADPSDDEATPIARPARRPAATADESSSDTSSSTSSSDDEGAADSLGSDVPRADVVDTWAMIRIHDLQGRTDLNGTIGFLVGEDMSETGRYTARVGDQFANLKPENFTRCWDEV
jgi:hypothetical protein